MESAEIWEQYEGHLLRKLDFQGSALKLTISSKLAEEAGSVRDSSDYRLSKDHQTWLASQSPAPEVIAQPETLEVTAEADLFGPSKSFPSNLNLGIDPVREDPSDPAIAAVGEFHG